MRILGIGEYLSLGDMYLRMQRRGHQVRVYVQQAEAHGIYAGLLTRCEDWREQLAWLREESGEHLIVFESASKGKLQDQLRLDGYNVIGGSAGGDRLETDRAWGQKVLRDAGLRTAQIHQFKGYGEALEFLRREPARYVYKLNDPEAASTRAYVGALEDGSDVTALIRLERSRAPDARHGFVLMEHVRGVEVGVGAYFNGEQFLQPALLDWEHKRFFPGDLGELTGEMGTVVTYRGAQPIFERTLARVAPALRDCGYVGYINLNLIANEQGIFPLEFTCRFGYPGFAICDALHAEPWEEIFLRMVRRDGRSIATHDGFAVGVVLTVPPFPYEYGYDELSKGAPLLMPGVSDAERERLHLGEVALEHGQLVTAGSIGYIAVATGRGPDVAAAREQAYALARKVVVPNVRYRDDIGEKFLREDYSRLKSWGYLD